jgi:hypothetical protein
MITLLNGAKILQYGEPRLFIMAGVHGEETAPIIAIKTCLHDKLKDVWFLPCLNIQGYKENNRFCGTKNLNDEFRKDTKLEFMQEFLEILEKEKPEVFVDMHEDTDAANDYIWGDFDNECTLDGRVRKYCKDNKLGLIYQPEVDAYYYSTIGTSQSFAKNIGIKSAYTTETMQYQSYSKRLKQNRNYIDFFRQN